MTIALAVLLFELLAPAPEISVSDVEPACDDGSSPWLRDGSPNWDCWLNGCSPHAEVCWPDRTADCRDASGADVCGEHLQKTPCEGIFECFRMWFSCTGTYSCETPGNPVGCAKGVCEIADNPPTPGSTYSAGSDLVCAPGAA